MKYDYRIAGQVIGKMRTELGMLQEPLSGLGKIESRYKNISVDTLWRIAEALDLKLSTLSALVEQTLGTDL